MNAIMHALEPLGVRELDMPATSDRIWRAIRDAKAAMTVPRSCGPAPTTARRCATGARCGSSVKARSRMSPRIRPRAPWWMNTSPGTTGTSIRRGRTSLLDARTALPWGYVVPKSADDLVGMGRCFSATTFLSAGNITHTPAYGHLIALGVLGAVQQRNASPEQIANAEAYRAAHRRAPGGS